jgi:hypothetical protein
VTPGASADIQPGGTVLQQAQPPAARPADPGRDDIAILMSTYRKHEWIVPAARANIELFWPDHPQLYILTDGELDGDEVIRTEEREFVAALQDGVAEIRRRQQQVRYIYLLLEDLAPLAPVDDDRLRRVENAMKAGNGAYFYMPWAGAHRHHVAKAETGLLGEAGAGLGIHDVGEAYPFYYSCVVAFWRVDYFLAVLSEKQRVGITDPWGFENPFEKDLDVKPEAKQPHFFIDQPWPTYQSGLFLQGQINRAIVRDRRFGPSPAKDLVYQTYMSQGSILERLKKRASRLNHMRKGMLAGVGS